MSEEQKETTRRLIAMDAASVARFASFSGGETLVNTAHHYVLRKEPTLAQAKSLLSEFRESQRNWLLKILFEPNGRKSGKPTHLYALAGAISRSANSNFKPAFIPTIASIASMDPKAWAMLDGQPMEGGYDSTRLATSSLESQHRFLSAWLGTSLDSIASKIRRTRKGELICPRLDDLMRNAKTGKEFIEEVVKLAEADRLRSDGARKESSRAGIYEEPILAVFLHWLAEKGWILTPFGARLGHGAEVGLRLAEFARPKEMTDLLMMLANQVSGLQRSPKRMMQALDLMESLLSGTTLRKGEDASPEMFEFLGASMDSGLLPNPSKQDQMVRLLYELLRDSVGRSDVSAQQMKRFVSGTPNRRELASLGLPEQAKSLTSTFAWVYLDSTDAGTKDYFPSYITKPYIASKSKKVAACAHDFDEFLASSTALKVQSMVVKLQRYLVWLVETGRDKGSIPLDWPFPERSEINDGKPLDQSDCYRAWLSKHLRSTMANACLSELGRAFELLIAKSDNPSRRNPVDIKQDLLLTGAPKTRTHRNAIDRGIMAKLREINRRDGFALSKSIRSHWKMMHDKQSGQLTDVWFPGVAILMDLMLALPLRGFQARFLDSGALDEEIVEWLGDAPSIRSNLNGVPGRQEGALYVFKDLAGKEQLGIYVNTNKTGADRDAGYEIPWCSDELRDSMVAMRDWQAKWSPLTAPIPCMEKRDFGLLKNPEVKAIVKKTAPLFRDPHDPDGWPITRGRLSEYWNRLAAMAESEYAAEGREVVLTEEAQEGESGWGQRRVAIYDIHSLRVSGISALIEVGMPPDLVQQVAGHSTIVMTLYYNKVKAGKLNESLAQATAKAAKTVDDPAALESDYMELRDRLFNTKNSENPLSLLDERRGRGDGAVMVMSHGVCPGTDCSTGDAGGEGRAPGGPLPRRLACSLCRHRLTGPAFLAGLTLNANRLMHEVRRLGKEIAGLNQQVASIEDRGGHAGQKRAQVETLYRQVEVASMEWAAEVQYVKRSQELMRGSPSSASDGLAPSNDACGSLLPIDWQAVEFSLESKSEFALLQDLAEGVALLEGFKPAVALEDHREFINEVMAASGVEPFLLRLRGDERDQAAMLLGKAICAMVPDGEIELLRDGQKSLQDFPSVMAVLGQLQQQSILPAAPSKKVIPIHQAREPKALPAPAKAKKGRSHEQK